MTIDISNNDPRISYSLAEGASQTVFSMPFDFFDNDDVKVYVDGSLQTLGSDYTISGGDGSTGNVNFVSPVVGAEGGSKIGIARRVSLERVTDFVAGQDINRAALNTQFDTLTAIAADLEDQVSRSIRLPDYNDDVNPVLDLPDLETRKGKYLGFDPVSGAPLVAGLSTLGAISIPVPLNQGGTAGITAADARANLGTTDEALALAIALG